MNQTPIEVILDKTEWPGRLSEEGILQHENVPTCWCDPIARPTRTPGAFILIHQDPTTH